MKYALLLWGLAGALRGDTLPLRAGVARVEITPATFMPMYGYANRKCGPANGTHDPLFAKVVVLAAGDSRMAIVTLDLGSIVAENLRRDVAEKLGIPVLLLASSHTHSGPLYLDRAGAESGYREEMERKVFAAVRDAAGSLFPARLALGRGSLQTGYNRRCCATMDAPARCSTTRSASPTARSIPNSRCCA